MHGTYLRRELAGRKKQTAIVAAGMAVAIALVIVVNARAPGRRGRRGNGNPAGRNRG